MKRSFLTRFAGLLGPLLVLSAGVLPAPCARAQPALPLRARLDAASYLEETVRFYGLRGYEPAWLRPGGGVTPDGQALVAVLGEAAREGLRPGNYRVGERAAWLQAASDRLHPSDPEALVVWDLALTEAFFRYARDLSRGRVAPSSLHIGWGNVDPPEGLPERLQHACATGSVAALLRALAPPDRDYAALRAALAAYRRLQEQGGWPALRPAGPLAPGDRSPDVVLLRSRLHRTAPEPLASISPVADSASFDEALEAAVRAFQERHGLVPDGVVGPRTLAALNVPVADRIRQIELSMERRRWLPNPPPDRYILINVAAGRLQVVEAGAPVLAMKVIVGKRSTPTPLLRGEITGVVLAPYWYVPASIARNEILPRLESDPDYLARHGMKQLPNGPIRQEPGPANPLGRLKFVFSNPFGIGLHDTPERHLFQRTDCAFSHGCIRLEKPVSLALYALKGDTTWTEARLHATVARWQATSIPLSEPIPVFVLYGTAWADEHGAIHFREDLYGYDRMLERALRASGAHPAL